MDWKQIVGSVAPGLATLAGGPLAGGVVKILADKLLGGSSGDQAADEAKLTDVLAGGLTPEARAAIIAADQAVRTELIKADVRKVEVAADVEKAYVADVGHARQAHASNEWVMGLAVFINVASYLAIGGVLYGCFSILNSTTTINVDPGIAAMVGSLVGAAVQWLLANAGQANGFVFGSSPGSRAMAESVGRAIGAAGGPGGPAAGPGGRAGG